jgi:hypothetical protein
LTVAATITDEFTDGYIRSVFQTLTEKFTHSMYPSVNHDITDRIKIHRYISSGKLFFGAQIPSVRPSANGFFVFSTEIATKCGIIDEGKAEGCNPLVKMSINKSLTNW